MKFILNFYSKYTLNNNIEGRFKILLFMNSSLIKLMLSNEILSYEESRTLQSCAYSLKNNTDIL